jgi:hypothetical protein
MPSNKLRVEESQLINKTVEKKLSNQILNRYLFESGMLLTADEIYGIFKGNLREIREV